MDPSSACSFFDIILGLFVESDTTARAKLVGEHLIDACLTSAIAKRYFLSSRRSAQSKSLS
jgi:hypothetical protein